MGPNGISAHFLFGKERVAPIEEVSIPRLELIACQMASRMVDFISRSLAFPVDKKFIWSDSQCVLGWLVSSKVLPIFVRNRVAKIREIPDVHYRYVPTHENPADLASRGETATTLANSNLWWHGPEWLCQRRKNGHMETLLPAHQ